MLPTWMWLVLAFAPSPMVVTWIVWFFLLIAQNASFTLVSRARNAGKASDPPDVKRRALVYHSICALFSNGIWIGSQFILIGTFIDIIRRGSWHDGIITALVYTVATMIGSVGTHYLALHKIEKRAGI